jgi:hypothetical protein
LHALFHLMRWLWQGRRELTGLGQRRSKFQELEEAKEILGEVFGIGKSEVEEMIRMRLEEIRTYDQEFNLD